MKKVTFLTIALLSIVLHTIAAGKFYTISSTPTWSTSLNGSDCSCSPTYNSDSIFVNHSITLGSKSFASTYLELGNNATITTSNNSSWTLDASSYFYINSGATFDQTKTTVTNTGTIEIDGSWITSSNGNIITNSGNLIINGTFDAKNGSLTNSGYFYIYGTVDIQNYSATNSAYIIGTGVINSANNVSITNSGYVNGATGVSLNSAVNYLGTYPSNGSTLSVYSGGVWSNGTPSSCSDNAQVNESLTLSSSNLICERLIVAKGATLTINSGYYAEVCGDIVNDGTIVVESGGSLNQTSTGSEVNSGTGTYTVKRTMGSNSGTTVSYVSSPITSANTNILTTNDCQVYAFDASSQFYAFDYPLNYVGDCNGISVTFTSGYVISGGDNIMDVGRGYVLYTSSSSTKTFSGTVNNKTVTVPIYSSNIGGGYGWNGQDLNLVGNPYPSAIDMDAFLTTNSSIIEGSVYLWDDDQTGGSGYSSADFFAYNLLGSSVNAPNSGRSFDGKLASGQGFFVIAKDPGNDGGDSYSLTFNNSHRVSGSNTNFFRTANEKTRMWIGISANDTIRNQALIGFVNDATTYGDDDIYDSHLFEGVNPFSIASKGPNGNYAIQGFEPLFFGESQLVPLTVKVPAAGNYSMNAISENFDQLSCILHDKKDHVYHTIMETDYAFNVSDTSQLNNRFELIITKEKLEVVKTEQMVKGATEEAGPNAVEETELDYDFVAFCNNSTITIASENTLNQIDVYTLSGQLIWRSTQATNKVTIPVNNAGVYMIKAQNTSGGSITKKVVALQ